MEEHILENSKIILWMGLVNSILLMGRCMRDFILQIRRKGLEYSNGLMERSMKGGGAMESRMDMESYFINKVRSIVSGLMDKKDKYSVKAR